MRRAVAILTAFLSAMLILFGFVATGAAAAQDGESIRGRLRNQEQPVQGVRITVTTESGDRVGSDTTGADGRWEVELERPGTYRVTIDQSTLPQGVNLRFRDRATLTVQVSEQQDRTVGFLLGVDRREQEEKPPTIGGVDLSRVPQLLFDGLNLGLIIALAALGLSLVFGTTGLTNFAHGEIITLGALLTYVANNLMGIPLIAAAGLAVAACGVFGYLQDSWIWGRLRRRGTGLIAMMIVSIGLAILLRYTYLYFFGGRTHSYAEYGSQAGWQFWSISAPPKALLGIAVAIVVLVAIGLALLYTKLGKATRAVADNPALAESTGIDVDRVIRVVWTVGAAIAGLGGIMFALSFNVQYYMGFAILLLVFAGTILGGLGTAFGALVGSLVVGLFIQLSTLWVPAEVKNAGALLVLILVLLFRPQGILGRRERVG
jgi:neutral amino acid transport system permease protein